MSESVGPEFVARDRTAPFLFYRGDMSVEWNPYGDDAKSWIESFVASINAYIDQVESEPDRLPIEFTMTTTRPAHWLPEDVVRCRGHARVRNLDTEIAALMWW